MWPKPTVPLLVLLTVAVLAVPGVGRAQAAADQTPADTAVVTNEMTDAGRKIFHGPGTCYACHGSKLQGMGLFPRLAGRSPTYLLRQLLAFRSGARTGVAGQPMRVIAGNLGMGDMIGLIEKAEAAPAIAAADLWTFGKKNET